MDPGGFEMDGADRPHLIPRAIPLDPAVILRLAPGEAMLVHLTRLARLSPIGLDLPGHDVLPVEHLRRGGAHATRIEPMRFGNPVAKHEVMLGGLGARGRVCAGARSRAPRRGLSGETS